MSKTVIYGSGGFARELAWALDAANAGAYDPETGAKIPGVDGFLDDDESRHGTTVNGRPVFGGFDWLREHPGTEVYIGIGIPTIKQQLVERLADTGAVFPSFISPQAQVGDHVTLGRGVVITAGCIVTTNIEIGDFAMLNLNVTVGHDVTIGACSTLSPGVNVSGNCHIGAGCDIGTNATLIPGVTVGDGSIIGAMACTTKDIPAKVTAVGIPAKVIKEHD